MALKVAGVFNSNELSVRVNQPAATQDDLFSIRTAHFASDGVKCTREENIIRVQKCKNIAGRQGKALVQGVCLPGVRFSN